MRMGDSKAGYFVRNFFLWLVISCLVPIVAADIPLPEHPRPDFQRDRWLNLNGTWDFRFDPNNVGLDQHWFDGNTPFDDSITVPFSWGAPLSGVADKADIGWYQRFVEVPKGWSDQRIFLVIGACDWFTSVWVDGEKVGDHQGGYTPFEFDLTAFVGVGRPHRLVLRVDDSPHSFKLDGKQAYGRAAGIWQTPYLEARPRVALEALHFTPDIDRQKVTVEVYLDQPIVENMTFELYFFSQDRPTPKFTQPVRAGTFMFVCDVNLPDPHLWSLADPYLYQVDAVLKGSDFTDRVGSYFGMRQISTGVLPGTEYPYVTLNHKPVYLEMTLDPGFNPQGYYTCPSDALLRDEILHTKQLGLNGQRFHVKVESPRKLYWADRLGVLIQADVPNSWGPPDPNMQAETQYTLRQMIKRDYNHPAIFSWVTFNNTWGLLTPQGERQVYTAATQHWVKTLYRLTKQLDPSRLVVDNSTCHADHVATDLNTWQASLPGDAWASRLDKICHDTYLGSPWNFTGGNLQDEQPLLNSECGHIQGYQGGSGAVDFSWDYHLMLNAFRRHPQCCGWLYRQSHDMTDAWEGYRRYDRSRKFTGLSDLVDGMSLRDLHSPFYIALESDLCTTVHPGESREVPVFLSCMTDQDVGPTLQLEAELTLLDNLGQRRTHWATLRTVAYHPWLQQDLKPLSVTMPEQLGLAFLTVRLKDVTGAVLHRNFTTYQIIDGPSPRTETAPALNSTYHILRFTPNSFVRAQWSGKQWNVLNGLKVNGTGSGFFEYQRPWPSGIVPGTLDTARLKIELGAKQCFAKDDNHAELQSGDTLQEQESPKPSDTDNSYPMTDETLYPSRVRIMVNGISLGIFDLPDDPADHRGILSWHSQPHDGHLYEAGSYGYLIDALIPQEALQAAYDQRRILIRFEVDDALPGGLAIYGEQFGRYPLDPTLVLVAK